MQRKLNEEKMIIRKREKEENRKIVKDKRKK